MSSEVLARREAVRADRTARYERMVEIRALEDAVCAGLFAEGARARNDAYLPGPGGRVGRRGLGAAAQRHGVLHVPRPRHGGWPSG